MCKSELELHFVEARNALIRGVQKLNFVMQI